MADEQKLKRVCGMHLNGSLSARNTLLSRAGIARFGETSKWKLLVLKIARLECCCPAHDLRLSSQELCLRLKTRGKTHAVQVRD